MTNSEYLGLDSPSKPVPTRPIKSSLGSNQPHFDSQKGRDAPASHVEANRKVKSRTSSFTVKDMNPTQPKRGLWSDVAYNVRPSSVEEPASVLPRRVQSVPGEWEPTPPRGMDPSHLKEALLRYGARRSADTTMQAMIEGGEEMAYDDLDSIEMSFPPGTLVETRKWVYFPKNQYAQLLAITQLKERSFDYRYCFG